MLCRLVQRWIFQHYFNRDFIYGNFPGQKMTYKSLIAKPIRLFVQDFAMGNGPFIDDKHDDLPITHGDFPSYHTLRYSVIKHG